MIITGYHERFAEQSAGRFILPELELRLPGFIRADGKEDCYGVFTLCDWLLFLFFVRCLDREGYSRA